MFTSTFKKSDAVAAEITVKVLDDVLNSKKSDTIDFVGAIDQGTSSTRFLVFTPQGEIGAWSQMEHKQYFPPGADKVSTMYYTSTGIRVHSKNKRFKSDYVYVYVQSCAHHCFVLLGRLA
jgi:hypothetical protein